MTHRIFHAIILATGLTFAVWSCVDVNNTNISVVDYKTQANFVNLAIGLGTAEVRLDGQSIGSADFAGEIPGSSQYVAVSSGSRVLRIKYSGGTAPADTVTFTFATDLKGRVFMNGDVTARSYVFASERAIYQASGLSDTVLLRTFHASPDVGNISIVATSGGKDSTIISGLAYAKGSGYFKFPATSSYTFTVISGTDTLFKNISFAVAAGKRYTAAIYDIRASIKQKLFTDD